jgi:hypothetical protein
VTRPSVGILISYVYGIGETADHGTFQAVQVEESNSLPAWRVRMEDWLEGDEEKPFVQENLCLTPNEILALKTQLGGLTSVVASVKSNSVKIVRI